MAELQLIVGEHSIFGDGDILVARSESHALAQAADRLCGWWHAGLNSDGYRPRGTLAERFHELVDQYRAERTAPGEITVRNQWTGEERVFSLGSQAVRERLRRLLKHKDGSDNPRHHVYGRRGREVFFFGRQRNWRRNPTRLDQLWTEIESRTEHRREDFQAPGWGDDDFRHFLIVTADPITRDQAEALEQPIRDVDHRILAPRRWWIDWRPLVTTMGVSLDDVLSPDVSVDVRPLQPRPVRQSDLQERSA